jgi:hypothetical protein
LNDDAIPIGYLLSGKTMITIQPDTIEWFLAGSAVEDELYTTRVTTNMIFSEGKANKMHKVEYKK